MQTLELDGPWTLTQTGKKRRYAAQVPGCVHTDLLAAHAIPEPYYRDNETRLAWIGEAEWVYTREFRVPAGFRGRGKVLLRCEGLDTFATLRLNGRTLGRTDNMYRTWEFDVARALKPGRNVLEVRFASTLPYIRKRQKERYLHCWNEGKGASWLRKQPCNYGWDWGPTLVTCGLWRSIRLLSFETARLTGVQVLQDHSRRGRVELTVRATAELAAAARAQHLSAAVTLSHAGRVVARASVPFRTRGRGADAAPLAPCAEAQLDVPNPQLWWPNGMGGQPLYEVTVDLLDAAGQLLDTGARRIGLRTLALERKKDAWGESFQFVVNGCPFFAKGANWAPADTFATRVSRADYRRLLGDARAAHMNMLRAWGGNIYEQDDFYDTCDELGLCVWQDFMFACATYPTFDAAFMANVREEVLQNVRRLRHHPCMALWCGNNELEQGLVGDKWTQWQMSWEDYKPLFDEMLPALVKEHDPEGNYWPCSPHSPHGDRKDHSNPKWGDAHLWQVWFGHQPIESYRNCMHRFVSEFGSQSFPEPKTVREFTAPGDRNISSYVMDKHQRSNVGNRSILSYMADRFRMASNFENTLWLSQIQHGLAIQTGVEHWRRNRPRTMGTLYWQINDCWPAASWSSIDYPGRWKALHYLARRFYAPLMISGVEDLAKGTVAVHVTSDLRKPCRAEVRCVLTTVNGRRLKQGRLSVRVKPQASARVLTLDVSDFLKARGPRDLLLWLELHAAGAQVSQNLVLFSRPKHLELPAPDIETQVREDPDGGFAVRLAARRPALWAWLELAGQDARFSDNFVHLRPGRPETITVHPAKPLPLAKVRKLLRVRSLVDTY